MMEHTRPGLLRWVHSGDLHLTAEGASNHRDLLDICDAINENLAGRIDFGVLHSNELAHDGRTVYATTRSTGQREEGPVGFSLMALDEGVVSWRFKPLHTSWPFVMVTVPADQRLAVGAAPSRGDGNDLLVSVEARDHAGNTDMDCIRVGREAPCKAVVGDGSDADRIGAWPERHLLDTQLGPNRNGRQW